MKRIGELVPRDTQTPSADAEHADAPVKRSRRALERALGAVDISERIEEEQLRRQRTEALAFGRAIALAGLPYRKTKQREITREIRLGRDMWVQVTYRAIHESPLPYGEDRFVLTGIQHLALQQGSPIVSFDEAGELLRLFGLDAGGSGYQRLRERLKRLRGLSVDIRTRSEDLPSDNGWDAHIVNAHHLPTRKQMKAQAKDAEIGQLMLPGAAGPYFVKIGEDWWKYLQGGGRNLLLVRLDLLRQFVSRPAGWDYLCFLAHRCGSAETESVVPHNVLMSLFKRGKEPDRNTIGRLKRYHDEIMIATDNPQSASLEPVGTEKRKGPGQPKKLWGLKVGPSDPLISSGRNVLEIAPSDDTDLGTS